MRAGALPLFLPYLESRAERAAALDRAGGLVLGFGRDIDPARYGAVRHPASTDISPERDAFELALAREALERGLPILGICRGLQVLNVALGGTLYRDRSEYPPPARDHPGGDWARWQRVCDATLGLGPMPEHPSHALAVEPGSLLAQALGTEATVVNSYHHQAVLEVGAGLAVTARAPDGIVEALELPSAPFVLAVQWELQQSWQDDPRFLAVFAGFAAAAGAYAAGEPARPLQSPTLA